MSNIVIQLSFLVLLILNIITGYSTDSDIIKAAASINSTLFTIAIAYISVISNLSTRD